MDSLDELVNSSGLFITDLEEISDTIASSSQLFLYDTAAISNHESVYNKAQELIIKKIQGENGAILITETILKEMFLSVSPDRYLAYLSNFSPVLYLSENNFYDFVKVDYENEAATAKFLLGSLVAFQPIQTLIEYVEQVKKENFRRAPSKVLDQFNSFFGSVSNKNKGELSLLWISSLLEKTHPNIPIHFLGIDSDLYSYVNRCYLSNSYDPIKANKKRELSISSNETLIQGIYHSYRDEQNIKYLTNLYRNEERNVLFKKITNGILVHGIKNNKFTNNEFIDSITTNNVQIIY